MITRPYDLDAMPTYEHIHATVPPTLVPPAALGPTQPMLDLARLLAIHHGQPPEGPDPYPHVAAYNSGLWVHNGHHRWVVALLGGDPTIAVRIARVT